MLIDARSLPDGAQLQCDLAVIGAGPAGLGIVDRLRASGLRICLLEGGGLEQTVRAQRLYRGEITGHPHYPLHTSRFRVFGGSGNRWGGWCHPLEPIDFEHRPQLPWSGWPVSAADLDRYNKDTAELLGLTTDDFGSASWRDRLPPGLPIEGGDFENAIFQISPRRDFGGAYRDRLRDSADVTVVLHANVTELRLDPGTDRVGTLRARTLRGNELSVRGRAVVLAAGAIENARLLLASRHDRAAGLGNERDQVGRNFMEHLHVLAGHLVVANPTTTHDLYREASYGAARVRGVITPTAEAQRREGLLGASIAIEPPTFPYGQPFLTAPPQLTVWPERAYRRLRRSNRGAGAVVGEGMKGLARDAWYSTRATVPRRAARSARARAATTGPVALRALYFRSEQPPNPSSRVTLGDRVDALGVPEALLDWRVESAERTSIEAWLARLDSAVRRGGIGRVIMPEPGWQEFITGGPHHMGTTRMSADPAAGVVDRNCRVHSVGNLYVAGSSVFATGGYANPTFTLLALALRVADEVRAVLT